MTDNLPFTIREMYRLANQYASDVDKFNLRDLRQIFNATRAIPYTRDLDSCGEDECLKRPAYGMYDGDCDDKAIFAGAALQRIGVPFRFVTVSYKPSGEMSHVYLDVLDGGKWRPFDPTYPQNQIFTEKPYLSKLTWDNPMLTKENGVAVLEGVGQDPVTVAAVAGSLQSVLGSIGSVLQNIPVVGGLFRGRTQHVDFDTAVSQANTIGQAATKVYDALDQDGKNLLVASAKQFFEGYVLPQFGTMWENYINNNVVKQRNAGNVFSPPRTALYHYISDPVFYFLTLDDVSRLQDDFPAWYQRPVQAKVWDPVGAYVKNRYGVSTEQLVIQAATGEGPGTGITGFIQQNPFLVLAGVGLLLFAVPGGRRSGGRR